MCQFFLTKRTNCLVILVWTSNITIYYTHILYITIQNIFKMEKVFHITRYKQDIILVITLKQPYSVCSHTQNNTKNGKKDIMICLFKEEIKNLLSRKRESGISFSFYFFIFYHNFKRLSFSAGEYICIWTNQRRFTLYPFISWTE